METGARNAPGQWAVRWAVEVLRAGGIIAYPTEGVYGLGCDPFNAAAVVRLLAVKGRPQDKGVILIASDFAQLGDLIRPLDAERMARVLATWPGAVTWVLPARPGVAHWLTGSHGTLAVRVTAHPLASALCRRFGRPVVSTSANRSGRRPARNPLQVRRRLADGVDYIVHGRLGVAAGPSEVRDAMTGAVLRAAGGGHSA